MPPLITAIIPTYRRPKLLKRAVKSALSQTFANLQVFVCDNNSHDDTCEVVGELRQKDSRVHYFCHTKTIPAAENFQFGISQVNTPFFSVLSDDDVLLPDFYQTGMDLLTQHKNAMFFWGSTIDANGKGKVLGANALNWKEEYYTPPRATFNVIQNYFNWTGAIFRKEVSSIVQIDPEVKPIDFDFMAKLSAQVSFVVSHKPCALFISHQQSYSANSGLKLIWPSWLKIMQNLKIAPNKVQVQMKDKLKSLLIKNMIFACLNKQFEETEKTLKILQTEFPDAKLKVFQKWKTNWCFLILLRLSLAIYQKRKISLYFRYRKIVQKALRN